MPKNNYFKFYEFTRYAENDNLSILEVTKAAKDALFDIYGRSRHPTKLKMCERVKKKRKKIERFEF